MTPFSLYLQNLRIDRNLRQIELAEVLGYDQGYISALEVGLKGPPTEEFVSRLISSFSMTAEEEYRLREAIGASQRKFILGRNLPIDVYWLFKEFREQADQLSPAQVRIIKEALRLHSNSSEAWEAPTHWRMKRRKEEAKM